MKANELRIGNLMNFPFTNEIVEVVGINAHESIDLRLNKTIINTISFRKNLNLYCEPIDKIKPIILTEEWLLNFGFKKIDYHRFKINPSKIFDYYYTASTHDCSFRFYNDDIITYISDVYYVHEIQNLYYALTGKELTFKNQE